MKHLDDKASLQQGDIIVSEDRAKKMSQPKPAPQKKGAAAAPNSAPANGTAAAPAPSSAEASKNGIRTVGPTFLQTR